MNAVVQVTWYISHGLGKSLMDVLVFPHTPCAYRSNQNHLNMFPQTDSS